MIRQKIYIRRAQWHLVIYHYVDAMWADEILDDLISIGCRGEKLLKAKDNLWRGLVNSGLTFSNCDERMTIMVIGHTSSGEEYWNSIDHEKMHLLQDIAKTCGMDLFGEKISYISGEVLREVYREAHHLLCDCCRKKV